MRSRTQFFSFSRFFFFFFSLLVSLSFFFFQPYEQARCSSPPSPHFTPPTYRSGVFIQLHESLPFPPGIPKFPSPSGIPPSAKPSPFLLLPAYPALIRHVWIVYAVLNHGGMEASAKLCFMPYQSFTRSSLRPTERRSRVHTDSGAIQNCGAEGIDTGKLHPNGTDSDHCHEHRAVQPTPQLRLCHAAL